MTSTSTHILRRLSTSPIQAHQNPEGVSFWMADGRRRIRVFASFEALVAGYDTYSIGILDELVSRELLERQRDKIEAAASRKYRQQGMRGISESNVALCVYVEDLR